jgi:hypothetical protein
MHKKVDNLLNFAERQEIPSTIIGKGSSEGITIGIYASEYDKVILKGLNIASSTDRKILLKTPKEKYYTFDCPLCFTINTHVSMRNVHDKIHDQMKVADSRITDSHIADNGVLYMYSKAEYNDYPKIMIIPFVHAPMSHLVHSSEALSRLYMYVNRDGYILHIPRIDTQSHAASGELVLDSKHGYAYLTRESTNTIDYVKSLNIDKEAPFMLSTGIIKAMVFRSSDVLKMHDMVSPYIYLIHNKYGIYVDTSMSLFTHLGDFYSIVYIVTFTKRLLGKKISLQLTPYTNTVNVDTGKFKCFVDKEGVQVLLSDIATIFEDAYRAEQYAKDTKKVNVSSMSLEQKFGAIVYEDDYERNYEVANSLSGNELVNIFLRKEKSSSTKFDQRNKMYFLSRIFREIPQINDNILFLHYFIESQIDRFRMFDVKSGVFTKGKVTNLVNRAGIDNLMELTSIKPYKQSKEINRWLRIVEQLGDPHKSGFLFRAEVKGWTEFELIVKGSKGETSLQKQLPLAGSKKRVIGRKDNSFIVGTLSRDDISNMIRELQVGKKINSLRFLLPNFMLTYGIFSCDSSTFDMVTKHEGVCTGKFEESFIVAEYIGQKITFEVYLEQRRNGNDDNDILDKILQIFSALQLANEKTGFNHNDLHLSNVMITDYSHNPGIFRYKFKSGKIINVNAEKLCMLIDFDRSRIKGISWDEIYYIPDYPLKIPDIWTLFYHMFQILLTFQPETLVDFSSKKFKTGKLATFYKYFFLAYGKLLQKDFIEDFEEFGIEGIQETKDIKNYIMKAARQWIRGDISILHHIQINYTSQKVRTSLVEHNGVKYDLSEYEGVVDLINAIHSTHVRNTSIIYNWGFFKDFELGKLISVKDQRALEKKHQQQLRYIKAIEAME